MTTRAAQIDSGPAHRGSSPLSSVNDRTRTLKRSDAKDLVVLVDPNDNEIGICEKLPAHTAGLLHRAISVFIFDSAGRLLLQQRAPGKYHCGGSWANSCCSHPYPAESAAEAAKRRCEEELGLKVDVVGGGTLHYRADVGSGLIENELVHLYWAVTDAVCRPDAGEIASIQWVDLHELMTGRSGLEDMLTPWLTIYLREIGSKLQYWSEAAARTSA